MLENFGLSVAAFVIFGGAALLFDAASTPDSSAAYRVIGGAVVLTAGVISAALISRSKLHWWRIQKQNRERT